MCFKSCLKLKQWMIVIVINQQRTAVHPECMIYIVVPYFYVWSSYITCKMIFPLFFIQTLKCNFFTFLIILVNIFQYLGFEAAFKIPCLILLQLGLLSLKSTGDEMSNCNCLCLFQELRLSKIKWQYKVLLEISDIGQDKNAPSYIDIYL